MLKKKQRLTEKRNHTWCDTIQGRVWEREVTAWLDLELDSGGSVSRCGVCPMIQDRVWSCERGTWLTGVWNEDGGRWERDVADWSLKMKMLGEGCGWLWSSRWRWIDFVTDVKLWIVSWGNGSRARRRTAGAGVWMLGLRKITRFVFVFIVPLKPNRFGLVEVFLVSGFWNRNRTEPKIFAKNLIGFFGYFFLSFLGLFSFSVFLLTPTIW